MTCHYQRGPRNMALRWLGAYLASVRSHGREHTKSVLIAKIVPRLACAASLSFLSVTAVAQNMTLTNSLEKYNVRAYSAQSPQFSAKASPILNQFSGDDLAAVAPHSVFVENGSGRNIWSITIIYTYPDDIASSGQEKRYVVTQSAPIRTKDDTMLIPGDQLLITPVRRLTVMHRPARGVMSGQKLPSAIAVEAADYKHDKIDSGKRVQISIDSVVFDDGEIVGPDTAARMVKLNERLDADRHLLDVAASLRGAALKEFLETTSTHPVTTERDIYETSLAGNFLAKLNSDGEEALLKMLQNIGAISPFRGNRITRRVKE